MVQLILITVHETHSYVCIIMKIERPGILCIYTFCVCLHTQVSTKVLDELNSFFLLLPELDVSITACCDDKICPGYCTSKNVTKQLIVAYPIYIYMTQCIY